MYVSLFISQPPQHKSKHKKTLKADKKEAVKNDIRYRTGFPKLSVHGYPLDNYRFARVPPKFSYIFSCKAQLAPTHNLFFITRQPIIC